MRNYPDSQSLDFHMRMKLALSAALLFAASPVAAQIATSNGQLQLGNQSALSASSQAPTTGVFCIEEIIATFCNVPTAPNTNGYGSSGGASPSSGAVSSSGSASVSSTGSNTSSIPPCTNEPPFNELCN